MIWSFRKEDLPKCVSMAKDKDGQVLMWQTGNKYFPELQVFPAVSLEEHKKIIADYKNEAKYWKVKYELKDIPPFDLLHEKAIANLKAELHIKQLANEALQELLDKSVTLEQLEKIKRRNDECRKNMN